MAVATAPSPSTAAPGLRPRRIHDAAPTAAVLLLYVGLAFVLAAPVWAHPQSTLLGNQVDSSPHVWFLAWPAWALGHGQNPLFTPLLGAPTGSNIAWNTPVFALALPLWPITALAGPVVTFNLVLTLGPALTAFATYLALRRYVAGSRLAALAGGLLAGFSPYLLAHQAAGHSNQVTAATAPLLLLLFDSLLVRQRRSPWLLGVALGALAAVQAYITEELLAGEVLMAATGLVVLAAVTPSSLRLLTWRRAARRLAQALLAAVPLFFLITGPLLWMQFFGPQHIDGAVRASNLYVTDAANLVVPTSIQALTPSRAVSLSHAFTGNLGEWGGYLGIPLIAAAVGVTVWQWRRVVVRWAACMAVIAVVLSLGPTLHVAGHVTRIPLPWRVLGHFPLLNSALPARLMLYAFLACALLVAVGIEQLVRQGKWRIRAIGAAVAALVVASLFPALPMAARPTAVPAFFTSASVRSIPDGSTAYILPSVNPETMLWQTVSGMRFRMLGGWYLGPDAQGHVHDGPPPTLLSDAVADVETTGHVSTLTLAQLATYRAELRHDAVQSIVVTPNERNASTVVQFFQEVTGTPPQSDGAGTHYWTGLTW